MLMNNHEWYISPMVRLELQYLHEIGRINTKANTMIDHLAQGVSLTVCTKSFKHIIAKATELTWTRDPFDRILVAHANLDDNILITGDETIRKHYAFARW